MDGKGLVSLLGISLILLLNFLSVSVIAEEPNLLASISKPRMVLYQNIVTGETLNFQNSVIANNNNDYDILVTIEPKGVWADKVELEESSFTLKPDERKEIFYNIVIEKRGYYEGDVLVTFEGKDSNQMLSLAQELVVIVTDENGIVEDTQGIDTIDIVNKFSLSGLAIVLVVILLALYKKGKFGRKRK